MNKQDLRQKALETIKECKEIIGQYLSGTIGLDENVRQAFAKYKSAMRTRYFTSDDISIEQKQAYHRRMVKRMRREGLHRMTDEEWKNRLTNKIVIKAAKE